MKIWMKEDKKHVFPKWYGEVKNVRRVRQIRELDVAVKNNNVPPFHGCRDTALRLCSWACPQALVTGRNVVFYGDAA